MKFNGNEIEWLEDMKVCGSESLIALLETWELKAPLIEYVEKQKFLKLFRSIVEELHERAYLEEE